MTIDTVIVGTFEVNAYILSNTRGEALVVDPGADPGKIETLLQRKHLSVCAYLLTHGHVDHISGLAPLHARRPAPVAMHAKDLDWAFSYPNEFLPDYPVARRPAAIDRLMEDRQEWTDAGMHYRIIETPGHTPGSVCLYFPAEHALFTGDTLFAGSVGRTDLPNGNSRQLTASLRKLAALPGVTRVFPGHGPATTIEYEKDHNFFMQSLGKPGPRG